MFRLKRCERTVQGKHFEFFTVVKAPKIGKSKFCCNIQKKNKNFARNQKCSEQYTRKLINFENKQIFCLFFSAICNNWYEVLDFLKNINPVCSICDTVNKVIDN